jgi:peptidoglycan-N-acetylglucosamine deacetylase
VRALRSIRRWPPGFHQCALRKSAQRHGAVRGTRLALLHRMLLLVVATALCAGAAYLLCYGGLRGPVDWIMEPDAHRARTGRRAVALTFDDGPDPARTPALLDALAAEDVKATFFLCGSAVDASPELSRRIAAEGHEIGNHTYNHPYLPLSRSSLVGRELRATDRAILATTGRIPSLVRPPYGGRSPWNVRAFARHAKRIVLWDVNSFDWRGDPADEVAQRVLDRVRPGSIVLLHEARDGGEVTIEAVRLLIPALRSLGYELVTVGEMFAAAAAAPAEAGATSSSAV